jgi:hypothetical protein
MLPWRQSESVAWGATMTDTLDGGQGFTMRGDQREKKEWREDYSSCATFALVMLLIRDEVRAKGAGFGPS